MSTTNSDLGAAALLTPSPPPTAIVSRAGLVDPLISDRAKYPARHTIVDGVSPWSLGMADGAQGSVVELRWSIVAIGGSRPVGDGGVIATETDIVVEVVAVAGAGSRSSMASCDCVMRTELDARSLADRQVSGLGWLLPIGYTVVVDTPIV